MAEDNGNQGLPGRESSEVAQSAARPFAPDTGRYDEDEISLLDLLVVVAKNLRLLIIGPLLAGRRDSIGARVADQVINI